MQVAAKLKYARISPQKCRLVADHGARQAGRRWRSTRCAFTPKKGARAGAQGARVGDRQRREQPGADVDELKVQTIMVDAAPAAEALPCARQGPRQPHRQAQQPHHRRRRRRQERVTSWVRKSIRSASASASRGTGRRSGMRPRKNFPAYVYTDYRGARVPEEEARRSVGQPHPDRARGAQGQHHDPHGASGHRDRQEGRGHREAARRSREDDEDAVHDVRINIAEIRKPELDAQLVAEGIAQQLERRVMFRRAMKRAVTNTMRIGALGIKVRVSRPPERRGNRAHRVVPRRPRAAAHVPRRHRLRPGRSARPPTASSA